MKLLGPKSISTGLSYLFLSVFIFLLLYTIYRSFLLSIGWYNYTYSENLLPNLVKTGKAPADNPTDLQIYLKFRFPFFKEFVHTYLSGKISFVSVFTNVFSTLFFFFAYKIFRELNKPTLFNQKIIKKLKAFSIINFIYAPVYILSIKILFKTSLESSMIISCFAFTFLGLISYFIMVFFQNAYQLQSENDLTI